jgi:hypothetical protein
VEDCLTFSVFDLKRLYDLSRPTGLQRHAFWKNQSGETTSNINYTVLEDFRGVEFSYTIKSRFGEEEEEQIKYRIPLVTTPCNYGGQRYWFICPWYAGGIYCGRRVAKLYLPSGDKYFACRHCYDLSYKSRQTARDAFYWALIRPMRLLDKKPSRKKITPKQLAHLARDLGRIRYHAELLEKGGSLFGRRQGKKK